MRGLRNIEGFDIMPEESQVGASAANAVVGRSVWEMQSTARSLLAYAEGVQNTTFEPGSAILAWAVEYAGQVVSRFQRSVSDGKTAYERRKQKSYRKALIPFGELVMFMPIEKPKDKGEVRYRVGIMLGVVDSLTKLSLERQSEQSKLAVCTACRQGSGGDARHAKSIRGAPWQPNPAEAAEGEPVSMARIVGVPMVPSEYRPVVPAVDPREYRARQFYS